MKAQSFQKIICINEVFFCFSGKPVMISARCRQERGAFYLPDLFAELFSHISSFHQARILLQHFAADMEMRKDL